MVNRIHLNRLKHIKMQEFLAQSKYLHYLCRQIKEH